ncbi:LysR family transcriptional regulator [Rhodococcus sp. NPDC019627]|uniref:LysR family transcriptional regulator n=1 Tax=unclassified Rhodococcus (in: high G+C Gram-positive bacteria) TaxID=192944 RepID=UPI0033EFF98B
MDIQQLEMFVAVAEEGSIHGGARRLLIAQPAVSKSLRKLERQLGTELLIRSPQGIGLTVAGEVLLAQAKEILERMGRTIEIVRKAGEPGRELIIGLIAGAVAAAELTKEIIRHYRVERPDVSLTLRELNFPNQFTAISDGLVDVALVRPPCPTSDVALTSLFDEPIMLCCREDHRLADKDCLEIADIVDEPMLDMADAPVLWTDFWLLVNERHGRPPTEQSVRTLSEMGLAVACSPRTVTPLVGSAWRLGMDPSSLSTVPLRDGPRSIAAVAAARGDYRDEVCDFVATAVRVTRERVADIPDAHLLA